MSCSDHQGEYCICHNAKECQSAHQQITRLRVTLQEAQDYLLIVASRSTKARDLAKKIEAVMVETL